ncbi:MAG: Fic family protein [Lachnospiraceae bacterium]|nr:Fic family protein [Lachnospiraceae bacterium]
MSEDKRWQWDLEEYIRQGEPGQAEKSEVWQTAIGLQAVDGLKTSAYLLEAAKEHIEGKIKIDEVQKRIQSYYEERSDRNDPENRTKEADIVASRIAEILGEKTFQFSPAEWILIHRRLFEGVFDHAGQIRTYNITKKEWILNEETVIYASWNSIRATLDYDFMTEKQFSYKGLSMPEIVKHLARFVSNIWQIHPFCEGNTRATAVYLIKYLKTLGFEVNNEPFEKHSWYFRNALVRANYNNLKNGIHETTKFLELFFSNLLMGTTHELKNRYMHVDYVLSQEKEVSQSITTEHPKTQNDTLECTLDERRVLKLLRKDPLLKQSDIAVRTGMSISTVKRITTALQKKGFLCRSNGKRFGTWEVLREPCEWSE